MIKVDVMKGKYSGAEIKGKRPVIRLELLLLVAYLLKNDVLKEVDKKAIKDLLDLDPQLYDSLLDELINTLNDL